MSEFLLIVPEGWIQMDWEALQAESPDITLGNVKAWIEANQLADLDGVLKGIGRIDPDATLVEAKLIDNQFFMIRLG